MNQPAERDRRIEELEERLSRLSEASLRINDSLDFDTVLQDVADSARALTPSRYGAINVFKEAGQTADFFVYGLTREERRAKADLETLIDKSPVSVTVFDAVKATSPSPSTRRPGRSLTAWGSRTSRRRTCWKW